MITADKEMKGPKKVKKRGTAQDINPHKAQMCNTIQYAGVLFVCEFREYHPVLTPHAIPSRDYSNFLHAAWIHAV